MCSHTFVLRGVFIYAHLENHNFEHAWRGKRMGTRHERRISVSLVQCQSLEVKNRALKGADTSNNGHKKYSGFHFVSTLLSRRYEMTFDTCKVLLNVTSQTSDVEPFLTSFIFSKEFSGNSSVTFRFRWHPFTGDIIRRETIKIV